MKNRFIVIYTIFAAAVFVFSISFFGYNLFNEYSTNLEKSDKKFTELVNDIRTLSFSQENNNAAYIQGIKKSVGDASDYSYIQVRRNNETVVLYPSGKSKEETISRLVKNFSTNLTVNKQTVNIDCNIYLIRPDSIFYFARISFLMILIITIITIIMIIYLSLTENTSDVISIEEDDEEIAADEEGQSDIISDNAQADTADSAAADDVKETEENEEASTEDDSSSESDSSDENLANEDSMREIPNFYPDDAFEEDDSEEENNTGAEETEEEKPNSEVTPEEVKAILSGPLTDEQAAAEEKHEEAKLPVDDIKPAPVEAPAGSDNEPAGLFDPETGIGWESYLFTRLNNEIDRATASEIDLSLFIIKLDSIEKTSETFKNVCNYLAIQFQFKDLLFEYKNDCIVAIKISMNVDEALNLATKLYSDIRNIVNSSNIRIGISSRSIRMLTGDRLILEAEQAIEHSDEASPVIAFRVDSEKYRQLMEGNR